jgi:hypothetical protein
MVLPPPIRFRPWDPFRIIEIDCEDLRKLLDTKRPGGYSEALQYVLSEAPIWLLDLLQYTLIRLV